MISFLLLSLKNIFLFFTYLGSKAPKPRDYEIIDSKCLLTCLDKNMLMTTAIV